MAKSVLRVATTAIVLGLLTQAAQAHMGVGVAGGFWSGVLHPITGWDHVIAMVTVGLSGAFLGSPAIWVIPVVFPVVMAFGGALGILGVPLPHVETGMSVSLGGSSAPAVPWLRRQSLRDLISVSAFSVPADHRELEWVNLYPGHDCGWVFLDETKNAHGKWCLMEVCGNRAKSTRHYARKVAT